MGTAQIIMPENYIAMFNAPDVEKAKKIVAAQIIMPESKNNISGYPRKGQINAKIIDYRRLINAVYVLLRESSQKYTFCKN